MVKFNLNFLKKNWFLLKADLNLNRRYYHCIEYLDNMALRIRARSSPGVINYLFNGLQSKQTMLNRREVISISTTSYNSNDQGHEGPNRGVDWKVAAVTFGAAVGFTVTFMHQSWKRKCLLAEEKTTQEIFNKENRQDPNESIIPSTRHPNMRLISRPYVQCISINFLSIYTLNQIHIITFTIYHQFINLLSNLWFDNDVYLLLFWIRTIAMPMLVYDPLQLNFIAWILLEYKILQMLLLKYHEIEIRLSK